MRRSLAHLPRQKKQELKRIAEIIVEMVPSTQMVILFGSHARGDWVETFRPVRLSYCGCWALGCWALGCWAHDKLDRLDRLDAPI